MQQEPSAATGDGPHTSTVNTEGIKPSADSAQPADDFVPSLTGTQLVDNLEQDGLEPLVLASKPSGVLAHASRHPAPALYARLHRLAPLALLDRSRASMHKQR